MTSFLMFFLLLSLMEIKIQFILLLLHAVYNIVISKRSTEEFASNLLYV
jgi:hypothetical protein